MRVGYTRPIAAAPTLNNVMRSGAEYARRSSGLLTVTIRPPCPSHPGPYHTTRSAYMPCIVCRYPDAAHRTWSGAWLGTFCASYAPAVRGAVTYPRNGADSFRHDAAVDRLPHPFSDLSLQIAEHGARDALLPGRG